MEFGVQFFPDVKPERKSGAQYFDEALVLAEEAEGLGFTHIRIVEHYFRYYGGYSPNPMLFLAAAAQRTRRSRLVTGAVLPVFNHPLKLAGEIGMLDALSGGRLDVGFARAFLPHEYRRFGRSPDESVARFREGIEQVELLLTCENVTHRGRFHTIENTTSLPRPTQRPRPKFYVAALNTPESFAFAGEKGYAVMAIPLGGAVMRPLLATYRGVVQCDGYAPYKKLPADRITIAFCWSHLRREFFKIAERGDAPIATEAVARIAQIYAVEKDVRGASADARRAVRQARSLPLVDALKLFLERQLTRLSSGSETAGVIRYGLRHWDGLTRFLDDGRIELDTNIVERSMRPQALTRKNALFAGHDDGAGSWAILASLIETCKLSDIEPQAYLADVLTRLVNLWPNNRLDELLPWAWATSRQHLARAA